MGKLLAKVKTAFLTETPSTDAGLFGEPGPLPSSKSHPAKVVSSTYPHQTKVSGTHHDSPSSSSNAYIPKYGVSSRHTTSFNSSNIHCSPSPPINNSNQRHRYFSAPENPFGQSYNPPWSPIEENHSQSISQHQEDYPNQIHKRNGRKGDAFHVDIRTSSSANSFHPYISDSSPSSSSSIATPASAWSPRSTSNTTPISSPLTPRSNPLSPAPGLLPQIIIYEDHENQQSRVPKVRSSIKEHARAPTIFWSSSPSHPLSPAAQPVPRYVPFLKTCNICLDPHPPTEFPTTPITSTCSHSIDDTCKTCLQMHLATQIASRGGAVLTCVCNQPLSFEDVQQHALPADFARYSERAAIGAVERYAHFVWCPHTGCSGGQIHEAGDAAPIVTCAACLRRYCYTHRVGWHAGVTCTQYDALTPDERVETIDRAEMSANAEFSSIAAANPRRPPQMPNATEQAERRRRMAEERAGEKFVRASGAKACPNCSYMTEKDGGCKHMTCRKCQHEYCWKCRWRWVSGHLSENC